MPVPLGTVHGPPCTRDFVYHPDCLLTTVIRSRQTQRTFKSSQPWYFAGIGNDSGRWASIHINVSFCESRGNHPALWLSTPSVDYRHWHVPTQTLMNIYIWVSYTVHMPTTPEHSCLLDDALSHRTWPGQNLSRRSSYSQEQQHSWVPSCMYAYKHSFFLDTICLINIYWMPTPMGDGHIYNFFIGGGCTFFFLTRWRHITSPQSRLLSFSHQLCHSSITVELYLIRRYCGNVMRHAAFLRVHFLLLPDSGVVVIPSSPTPPP